MRLEITQRAELAVRALVALEDASGRLKSVDLAGLLGTTAGFVPQVMGPLVRVGWVRSVSGPTGGYELVCELDTLSVLDVVETVDGPTDTGRCVVAERVCDPSDPCVLHVAWGRARDELRSSLGRLQMSEVGSA